MRRDGLWTHPSGPRRLDRAGQGAGERRIVSVLVADVAGSTAIGEKLGPERSKFLFDDVVRLMREEVERFGGTVAQLTGDGVLALFGAPVAHEDDAERAVRAALAIHEALARYAAEVAPAYGIELARASRSTRDRSSFRPATPPPTSSTTRSATRSMWPRACRRSATSSSGPTTARQVRACSSSRSSAISS